MAGHCVSDDLSGTEKKRREEGDRSIVIRDERSSIIRDQRSRQEKGESSKARRRRDDYYSKRSSRDSTSQHRNGGTDDSSAARRAGKPELLHQKRRRTSDSPETRRRDRTNPSAARRADGKETLVPNVIETVIPGDSSVTRSSFRCNYCHFAADNMKAMALHLNDHLFRCSYCSYYTDRQHKLLDHLSTRHDRPYPLPYDLLFLDISKRETINESHIPLKLLGRHQPVELDCPKRPAPDDGYISTKLLDLWDEASPLRPVNILASESSPVFRTHDQDSHHPSSATLITDNCALQNGAPMYDLQIAEPTVSVVETSDRLKFCRASKTRFVTNNIPQEVFVSQLTSEPFDIITPKCVTSSLKLLSGYCDDEEPEIRRGVSTTVKSARKNTVEGKREPSLSYANISDEETRLFLASVLESARQMCSVVAVATTSCTANQQTQSSYTKLSHLDTTVSRAQSVEVVKKMSPVVRVKNTTRESGSHQTLIPLQDLSPLPPTATLKIRTGDVSDISNLFPVAVVSHRSERSRSDQPFVTNGDILDDVDRKNQDWPKMIVTGRASLDNPVSAGTCSVVDELVSAHTHAGLESTVESYDVDLPLLMSAQLPSVVTGKAAVTCHKSPKVRKCKQWLDLKRTADKLPASLEPESTSETQSILDTQAISGIQADAETEIASETETDTRTHTISEGWCLIYS